MADGYDPQKSRVAEDTLADFLRAPLTGDLTEVPGIGPAAVSKLGQDGEDGDAIENTFQLIGKFLLLKVRPAVAVAAQCVRKGKNELELTVLSDAAGELGRQRRRAGRLRGALRRVLVLAQVQGHHGLPQVRRALVRACIAKVSITD